MKLAVFPRAWGWFFDEILPAFVKTHYSPKENWKERPFTRPDAIFFLKGVRELSDKFTEGRDQFRAGYFNHQKFRSSYLLYFLPLQAAKFLLLMDQHKDQVSAIIAEGKKKGKIRIADVGAGPGTASIALLLYLLGHHQNDIPNEIEFVWCDENEKMMEDGLKLLQELCRNFRPLEGKVTVKLHVGDWKRHRFLENEAYDWTLFGHVLNEGKSFHQTDQLTDLLREWVERSGVGGVLFVEPSFRASSQLLGKIRDQLLKVTPAKRPDEAKDPVLENELDEIHEDEGFLENAEFEEKVNRATLKKTPDLPIGVIGPCLHEGKCPLANGKDWCHFSVRAETPGKWFEFFSKGLSSQKEWIKYTYLWLRANPPKRKNLDPMLRLVLTDSLTKNPKGPQMFLLCEADRPRRISLPRTERVRRGDLIKLGARLSSPNEDEDDGWD
jgi:hypothetical protein